MDVSKKLTDIMNYYSENKGCDPNVAEFFDVCDSYAVFLRTAAPDYGIYGTSTHTQEEGRKMYPIAAAVNDKFELYEKQFFKKLLGNDLNIKEDSPLYEMCTESLQAAISYSNFSDNLLRRQLASATFYIAQQRRDESKGIINNFRYDNTTEYNNIKILNSTLPECTFYNNRKSPRSLLMDELEKEYNMTDEKSSDSRQK